MYCTTFNYYLFFFIFYYYRYASRIGPQVLTFYEDYFQIPFPLPKQDMVALKDLSFGGMENWGMITYRYYRFKRKLRESLYI